MLLPKVNISRFNIFNQGGILYVFLKNKGRTSKGLLPVWSHWQLTAHFSRLLRL